MNKKVFWLSILAVAASFVGGFLVANSLNKNELTTLRSEIDNLRNAQTESEQSARESKLTDDEIRQRIVQADNNPSNIQFQKNLGLALYNYARMRQDTGLLAEVARLVTRVYDDNPNDYAALVTLGNINFDIGYFNKSDENFAKAREFYQKALKLKSTDADVITDLGLTYSLAQTPDNQRAAAEFEKSLKINPKNEKTLQATVELLKNQGKIGEAEEFIVRLREINPNNRALETANRTDASGENVLQKQ